MRSVLKHHLSLGKPLYLAGSLLVSSLLQGFISANIAYYIKIVTTERPLQLFITDQKIISILILTFNSIILFISMIYSFFRLINYQNKDTIKNYRDFYIFVRIMELLMVIVNVILLYGLVQQPNSFIMPLNNAREMFWYGVTVLALLTIEIIWNFGVLRGGISEEERSVYNKREEFLIQDENPYIESGKIESQDDYERDYDLLKNLLSNQDVISQINSTKEELNKLNEGPINKLGTKGKEREDDDNIKLALRKNLKVLNDIKKERKI